MFYDSTVFEEYQYTGNTVSECISEINRRIENIYTNNGMQDLFCTEHPVVVTLIGINAFIHTVIMVLATVSVLVQISANIRPPVVQ